MGLWHAVSPSDGGSHLLQGIRLSTEFLNSLMWFASVTNVTEYRGNARWGDKNSGSITNNIVHNDNFLFPPPCFVLEKNNFGAFKKTWRF